MDELKQPDCPNCNKKMKPAGGMIDGNNNPTTDWACWDCNERIEDLTIKQN